MRILLVDGQTVLFEGPSAAMLLNGDMFTLNNTDYYRVIGRLWEGTELDQLVILVQRD